MDLRNYYQKIRAKVLEIENPFPVVVSHETVDGGKPGILTEVTRAVAAKMLVEGVAHLASPEEAEAFHKQNEAARRLAEQAAAATKMQFAILSSDELQILRELSPSKG